MLPDGPDEIYKQQGSQLAKAEMVSPPATENAKGKLEAPNTPTTPRAICI